jgi:hypothetical protein
VTTSFGRHMAIRSSRWGPACWRMSARVRLPAPRGLALTWIGRKEGRTPALEAGNCGLPRLSPEGDRLVVGVSGDPGPMIWAGACLPS